MLWSKWIIVSRKLVSSPGLMGMGGLWWDTMRTEHQSVLLCQETQVWLWRKLRKHTLSHDCLYTSQLPGSNIHIKDTVKLEGGFCNLHSPMHLREAKQWGCRVWPASCLPDCELRHYHSQACRTQGSLRNQGSRKAQTASQWLISLNILGLY